MAIPNTHIIINQLFNISFKNILKILFESIHPFLSNVANRLECKNKTSVGEGNNKKTENILFPIFPYSQE